jgi:hypothetical protein
VTRQLAQKHSRHIEKEAAFISRLSLTRPLQVLVDPGAILVGSGHQRHAEGRY